MVTAEHLSALSSKAHRVDHACSQLARQDVVPANISNRIGGMATDRRPEPAGIVVFSFIAAAHPFPIRSELGGGLSRSHESWLPSGLQPLSSRPSSQSWSPLQTRDWLMHWPAEAQERLFTPHRDISSTRLIIFRDMEITFQCGCNTPEVQRNLFPQPASRGQLFVGTHDCVCVASPEHGTPPNWAKAST